MKNLQRMHVVEKRDAHGADSRMALFVMVCRSSAIGKP